jgi:archaellum biogenesis protein FlaJ (TadC family)
MDVRRITTSEILAAVGGALLALSVFLPWYSTNPKNPNATIAQMKGHIVAWEAHTILRYLFLAAALAPIVLLYIVIRDHELSWPRGEMTAVIGIIAFGLVVYQGVIDRPGEPPGEINLSYGWFIALLGTILITVGGSYRASTTERPRKPPGVM